MDIADRPEEEADATHLKQGPPRCQDDPVERRDQTQQPDADQDVIREVIAANDLLHCER